MIMGEEHAGGRTPPGSSPKFETLGQLQPLLPVVLYILCISGCQFLSALQPSPKAPLSTIMLGFVSAFIGISPGSDPFLAILTGVNIVTIIYGAWYYTDQRDALGNLPAGLALILVICLWFQASQGPKMVAVLSEHLLDNNASIDDRMKTEAMLMYIENMQWLSW